MVKSKKTEASNSNRENPDVLERKRLKKLAITNGIVSDNQVKAPYSLNPSKTVAKHHGKDIVRKSQRKNRFLFSFPGLLGPINGGGKIGELKDLSSKNPVLYLDFPQGQMKLFGTILYPKNRYLTLQFSRSGKNVMCEDYFDHMIIFSEAWWIGTKEQNPEELKLDFPKELFEVVSFYLSLSFFFFFIVFLKERFMEDILGAGSVNKQVVQKSGGTKYVKEESPETELDDDLSDDNNDFKELKETTPIRQSARTSGKKFKFTEVSSGDDSAERSPDALGMEEEEEKKHGIHMLLLLQAFSCAILSNIPASAAAVKTNMSSGIIPDIESESSREGNQLSEQIQAPVTKSKKLSESSFSVTIPKENPYNSHGSLVQPTISTLFKKVQEKKKAEEKYAILKVEDSEDMYFWYSTVPDQKLKKTDLKRKIDPVEAPMKRGTVTEGKKAGYALALISIVYGELISASSINIPTSKDVTVHDTWERHTFLSLQLQQICLTIDSYVIIGTGTKTKKKVNEVEDDDIEEFSCSSQKFDVSITAILLILAEFQYYPLTAVCEVLKEAMEIGKPEIVTQH
ncbi:hypothetical protein DKX38_005738 [Salix brachista]|uniref:DNA-binding protein RHL1 n=1 Tax=Salix brachista TaxID=2182728 RepID=A0A5N5N2V3_9ROSI|nr:hypothetical protein DKX38_005738 [Salix brachista]